MKMRKQFLPNRGELFFASVCTAFFLFHLLQIVDDGVLG